MNDDRPLSAPDSPGALAVIRHGQPGEAMNDIDIVTTPGSEMTFTAVSRAAHEWMDRQFGATELVFSLTNVDEKYKALRFRQAAEAHGYTVGAVL
jgi:hypothetical protein